jgi:hypothetical protein
VLASLHQAGRDADQFTWATNLVVSFEPETGRGAWQGWHQLSGSSDTIADYVFQIAQAGFTVINVAFPATDAIERFAGEVIQPVRAKLAAR